MTLIQCPVPLTDKNSIVTLPEEHDILPQLLDRARCLHVCISIKANGKGMYDLQLAQGLCLRLQPLIAASHCLCTLQPACTQELII